MPLCTWGYLGYTLGGGEVPGMGVPLCISSKPFPVIHISTRGEKASNVQLFVAHITRPCAPSTLSTADFLK